MAAKGAVSRQLSAARGPSRAQQQGRGGDKRCGGVQPVAAAGALEPSAKGMNMTASQRLQKFASTFTIFFPLWTVIAAGAALARPETYTFMSTDKFTGALAILMLSMGITLSVDDFKRVFSRPLPVGIGFLLCFGLCPALALALSKALALPPAMTAGMLLVGSINGGQASNLCTYIARGNVALSVIMTTSTTIGCCFMTPLLAKIVLGTIIPVDAVGIAKSTAQVVLAPIVTGMTLNRFVPRICRAIEPLCPVVGVITTCLLVGSSVAQVNNEIIASGMRLHLACIILHLTAGLAGYAFTRLAGCDEITSRTSAIETSMKSSAFGFLLAKLHFADHLVRVPSAASVVWMALAGASLAVYWRQHPPDAPKPN